MKKILIAISLLGLMQFTNCTKTPVQHYPIDTFLLNHFNYKLGTYWIYKDSLTGEEDSFFVHDNTFSSIQEISNSPALTDNIDIDIFQYNNAKQYIAKWKMSLCARIIFLAYAGNIDISYNAFILIPFKAGLIGYNDADSGYVISVNNIDTINSVTYYNIAIIRHLNDFFHVNAFFDDTFYFNSDVGIIKMDLKHDTHNIWELERCKIIRN